MDSAFLPNLTGEIREVVRNKIIYHTIAAGLTPQQLRRVTKIASDADGQEVTKVRLEFHGRKDALIVEIPGRY